MKQIHNKQSRALRRKKRARTGLTVTADRPRLSVHRTLKHIRGQVIDHEGKVLVQASDTEVDKKAKGVAAASATGKLLAERAKKAKVEAVVFDKSHYKYHGRVKAFADAAREAGLSF